MIHINTFSIVKLNYSLARGLTDQDFKVMKQGLEGKLQEYQLEKVPTMLNALNQTYVENTEFSPISIAHVTPQFFLFCAN
jgi:uncharacterized protein with von Willebrand factor type A (vWA) domain